MASSSSSPPTSSSPSSVSSSNFAHLPIRRMKEKIVEKIMENRVTLIVGETGCGKSSQIPLFLHEEEITPVLCTQPRRFAVVAVAKMVAKVLQCEVGEEVGYHIGNSKVASARSKIVFKTAGVLLEEMRDKGLRALNYKVIILDEVHERSVESDLVLVCVKQFLLKNNDIRLVLMSATADITRYRDYFKDLGRGERVEVLAIPTSTTHSVFQKKILHLEQVTELLGISSTSSESLSMTYCSGPTPSMARADIKNEVHKLIHDLVLFIHKNEPNIEKSILIFLPTYYSLEQQWFLLKPFSSCFKVHILHSSIDTEQALLAMKIWKSHRKVILATNIAESSVTIPEVAYVIDSCRSLQVRWDSNCKLESADLVWVSKSQADQRKGRTGRTCDGKIYRLVTGSFFGKLQEFEFPAILKMSLRSQVLSICCAEARMINDPKALLQKALDPPDPEVISDALDLLVQIKALKKTHARGRYEPTLYGRLLTSFSLSFDASVVIVKFAGSGMLHEGILIGILMDILPLPIVRPFGQETLSAEYTDCYYDVDVNNPALAGRKEVLCMGNFCAYQFWQRVFKDHIRLERIKQLLDANQMKAPLVWLPQIEDEWCSFHNLVQRSLHQISAIYDDILSSFHLYRPEFLSIPAGRPSYCDPYVYRHTCLLQSQPCDEIVDEQKEKTGEIRRCINMPYVKLGQFQSRTVAERFAAIIKEMRLELAQEATDAQKGHIDDKEWTDANAETLQCRFFLKGLCKRGNDCFFAHSLNAKPSVCKFFTSLQGCRNGDSCNFSHDRGTSVLPSASVLCATEQLEVDAESLVRLFPRTEDGHILLLDDVDLHFASSISEYFDPSKIISTTRLPEACMFDPSLPGVKVIRGVHHPQQILSGKANEDAIPWHEVKCVLWFPDFGPLYDNVEAQKSLVQNFFECLAVHILAATLYGMHVVIIMNNVRFSLLQVEKLGRDSFFFLTESFPFDESSFGMAPDMYNTKKAMVVSRSIVYTFDLHPPTDLQHGDYASVLSDLLNRSLEITR